MKNQKGITLIALVITIIVLLILAGITIAMLTGENGLITKASDAASETAVANAKDSIMVKFQDEVATYLKTKYTTGSTPDPITVTKLTTGIDANGCLVTPDADAGTITIKHPADGTAKKTLTGTLTFADGTYTLNWQ